MSKRKESLTGGTGDVNPQWYKMNLQESANDTTTIQSFQLPVTRIPQSKKVTIMEILKIAWFHSGINNTGSSANRSITAILTTANPGGQIPVITDGSIVSQYGILDRVLFTTSGAYDAVETQPYIQDLTDSAGHGFLVATDQLWLTVTSSGTAATVSVACWLYYRFKNVGIEEYVGIVQGQSNL